MPIRDRTDGIRARDWSTETSAAWGKRRDMVVHCDAPVNCEPPPAVLAENEITTSDAFYCRNHGAIPDITPGSWRLQIGGTVGQPLTLTYRQLTTAFTVHEVAATLECAGNRRAELLRVRPIPGKEPWAQGAISTAVWQGAALADVLREAGVQSADGLHVAFSGVDVAPESSPVQVYGGSIPLDKAMSDEVLLAWRMNGEPLPRIHGGPVRLVVPGFIGARSVKWLTDITVQSFPSLNYFQAVDYRLLPAGVSPAPGVGIALSSLLLSCGILAPDDGATVPAGPVTIRGYAIAEDTRRIARVEVSTNGGAGWQTAELRPAHSRWAWRHWSLTFTAEPGPLRVTARAWTDTGSTHPESPAALWNPAGYANNSWPSIDLTVT